MRLLVLVCVFWGNTTPAFLAFFIKKASLLPSFWPRKPYLDKFLIILGVHLIPFLVNEEKSKKVGVIVEHRSEAGKEVPMGMQIAAEEILKAVERKDVSGLAMALRNAFLLLDSMPHEEGEHTEG